MLSCFYTLGSFGILFFNLTQPNMYYFSYYPIKYIYFTFTIEIIVKAEKKEFMLKQTLFDINKNQ